MIDVSNGYKFNEVKMDEAMYDSVNEDEFSEWHPRHSEEPGQVQQVFATTLPKKRGRPKIPEQWTRVMADIWNEEAPIRTWPIATDLLFVQGISWRERGRDEEAWHLLFRPKEFAKIHEPLMFEDFKIGEAKLLQLGVEVTELRRELRDRALSFEEQRAQDLEAEVKEISKLAKKIDKGYFPISHELWRSTKEDFAEETESGCRRRMKKLKDLSVCDRITIVHQVLVDLEKQSEVANEWRVHKLTVHRLIKGAQTNKKFLEELILERDAKELRRKFIAEFVSKKLEADAFIDSAESIQREIREEIDVEVKLKEVRRVMTEDLGMSYRKIKPISVNENKEKNIILRQQWALEFLKLSKTKKYWLNIDETWLGMQDFRRRKWRAKGSSNSVPILALQPRISMIVAIDNFGSQYVTLTQANSNSAIMSIYLRELVKTLDMQRPGWREDTVIFWDGAMYHQSGSTIKLLEELKLPMMLLAPHSYNAAPCELYFARFKAADINPRHVKAGKSNFKTVAELVARRARDISQAQIVLFWHHTLRYTYQYLTFFRQ